jgi:hypothetical protein
MVTLSGRRERIDQLAELLDGTRDEDEVRGDVRRLATLAGTVQHEIELPVLDAASRERIRTVVMAGVHTDLQEREAVRTGPARAPRSARTVVATGVASVLIGTGGVAVAAQEALPGDALYGIKQATESVRMATAGDATEQGRLHLALASERLEEIEQAVARGGVRNEALVDTFIRMDDRSLRGAEALVAAAGEDGDTVLLTEVARFTERQASGIVDVFDDLPIDVRPHAEDSLATLRHIRAQMLAPAFGVDVAAAELSGIESLLRSSSLPARPAEPVDAGSQDAPGATSEGDAGGTLEAPRPAGDSGDLLDADSGGTVTRETDDPAPRLRSGLEDASEAVDDTVGGVVDGTGRVIEDTTDAVEDAVGGVIEGTRDAVDDVVDGVGGLLD